MAALAAIAADFKSYVHKVPYAWAGASPRGWDCSGAANYVLCHDMGYAIPGFAGGTFTGRTHGPNTAAWFGFAGMRNIARGSVAAGDIVLWSTHMGIATSNTDYVSAYDTALGTVIEPIHGGGPVGETASFWRLTEQPHGGAGGGGGGGGGGGPVAAGPQWDALQKDWAAVRNTLGPWGDAQFKGIFSVQKRMEAVRRR